MAQQQKILLYVLPLVFAVSGVNFPIGVLIYWPTTNLWSMGQQFYVIRRMPAPGSLAEKAMLERKRKHGEGSPAGHRRGRGRSADPGRPAPAAQASAARQAHDQARGSAEPQDLNGVEAGAPASGEPADVSPSRVEPKRSDGTPTDGKSTDGKPSDGKPSDGKPVNGKPANADPVEPTYGTPRTPSRKKPKSGR